jgi:hypothetical protein
MKMHQTIIAGLTFAALAIAQPAPFSTTAQLKAACETSPGNVVVINTPVKVFNGPALPAVETVRTGCRLVFGSNGSIEFDNVGMRFTGALSLQASAKTTFSMKKALLSANSVLVDFAAPEGIVVLDESRLLATAGSVTIDVADDGKLQISKPLAGAINSIQASGLVNLQGGRKYELAMAETRIDAGTGIAISTDGPEGMVQATAVILNTRTGQVNITSPGAKAVLDYSLGRIAAPAGFSVNYAGDEASIDIKTTAIVASAGSVNLQAGSAGSFGVLKLTEGTLSTAGTLFLRASEAFTKGEAVLETMRVTATRGIDVVTGDNGLTSVKINNLVSSSLVRAVTGPSGACIAESNTVRAPQVSLCQ